jgi:hypothetical protein
MKEIEPLAARAQKLTLQDVLSIIVVAALELPGA